MKKILRIASLGIVALMLSGSALAMEQPLFKIKIKNLLQGRFGNYSLLVSHVKDDAKIDQVVPFNDVPIYYP